MSIDNKRFLLDTYPSIFDYKHHSSCNLKGTEYFLSDDMRFNQTENQSGPGAYRSFRIVRCGLKLGAIFHNLPEETQGILAYHLNMFP
jgi:hypothetical protein